MRKQRDFELLKTSDEKESMLNKFVKSESKNEKIK